MSLSFVVSYFFLHAGMMGMTLRTKSSVSLDPDHQRFKLCHNYKPARSSPGPCIRTNLNC